MKNHVKPIATNQLNTDNNTRNIIIQKSRIKTSNQLIHHKHNNIYLWDNNPINKTIYFKGSDLKWLNTQA